ncbi:MAG: GAF domain-containing protein [Deltaproteobacteria bacterium]|nr:GAF domain-containing protein [Deltaproteobacteria bacterium]
MIPQSARNLYLTHPKDRRKTGRLWERFNVRQLREEDLRDPYHQMLVQEWARVQDLGVDPVQAKAALLSQEAFARIAEEKGFLIRMARRVFERVRGILSGLSGILIFADAEGTILCVMGDTSVQLEAARESNLVEGGQWGEGLAGTNGIGTALARRGPVHVFSSEHFCEGWHRWTCAGAPVLDPFTQEVLGVVDFTTAESQFREKASDLVYSLASNLSAEIRAQVELERVQLLHQRASLAPDIPTDRIVLFDRLGHRISTGRPESPGRVGEDREARAAPAPVESRPVLLPGAPEPAGTLVVVDGPRIQREGKGRPFGRAEPLPPR